MFLSLIFILIAIFGLYSYQSRKYSNFIIVLFFILTSGFGFIPAPEVIKLPDVALFLCLAIGVYNIHKGKEFFSAKNDIIAKLIYALLGYYTLVTIITVFMDRETFFYSIKIWRLELYYLSYFAFRKIPIHETEKAIKPILFFSAITGIFFLLQFIGIVGILSNEISDEIFSKDNLARFRNAPTLLTPLLFYLLYFRGQLKYKYAFLLLFVAVAIFAQSRGLMAGIVISIVVYQLLIKQLSKLIRMFLLIGIIGILFLPIIQYRFISKEGSRQDIGFFEEINKGFLISKDFNRLDREDIEGSFSFRMFLANERMQYLTLHPEYLLTGVGTLHEDSPNNRFNFIIGSFKTDEKGNQIEQQIDTNDISFVTHIFRYGVFYFIIFIIFIIASMKRLFRSRNRSVLSLVAFLLFVEIVSQSLGADQFSTFVRMVFPLLILAQTNYHSKRGVLVRTNENILQTKKYVHSCNNIKL